MHKLFLIISSISGALAVGIGAFGAHGFKSILEGNERVATFETGVKYHLIHTLALVLIAILYEKIPSKLIVYSGWSMVAGFVLFSGSLYALSLSGNTKFGMIAPFGGLAFILGWVLILVAALKLN